VSVDSPQDGSLFQAGDTISFSASGSDPEDGTLGSDAFTWDIVFDHNPPEGAAHTHPVLTNYQGASGSFDVPMSGHGYSTDTSYTLTVTATDSDGLSASDSVTIEPDKVDVTFATDPGGLELSVDGVPVTDGTVIDTLVDFEHTVSAPTTQCLDGREYEFQSWSDGGAQTHTYTVPPADATLTATYQDVGECSTPITDGLIAQFETDQGLSTSNGQVTGWADQSGQGNDLTAVGDPTTTTAPSGQPAVNFDGDGDKLERTATLNGFPSGNGDRTVVLVTKYESTGYGGFAFGDDDSNQAFGTVVDPSGDLMVQAWGSSNDFSSGVAGTGEGWLVQSATLDSSSLTHYKNGQVIDTRTHSYATDLQQMVLGAEIDSDPYLDMEVAAVYVYDRALSDTERQQVESHLQDKYLSQGTTNQNPTASDDSATVDAGGSVTVDVLANDDDPEGNLDPSTVTIDQSPAYGTVSVDQSTGEITYTHDGSDTTSDSFVYQVSDDQGAGDAATVSVSIDQGATDSSLPVTNGLVTHYAADEGVSVGTGDVVTGWADQSGQGNDLTATGDPLVKHDTLNGNQVLSFDGDGDALVRTDTLNGLPSGSADRTVMYVVNYQSSPSWGGGIDYGAANCNQAFGLIVHDSQLQVHGWCDDFTADTSADVGPNGWMTHSAVLAADQVTHYKNGTQIDQYTHTYDTNLQKLVIGAEIDEEPYVDMEVAEVVIYDRALTETERQQVEDYFDAKYFTQVQNTAPTASDDSASVTAGQSVTIDVLANDGDSDGTLDASSVQVTSGPSTGSTSVDSSTGEITYTAPAGTSGDVTFTYSVADDDGATDTATVTVSVDADTGTGTYDVTTGEATNVVIDTSTQTNAAATLSGSLTLGDKSEAKTYVRFWVQGQPETKYWYDGETVTTSGDFSIDVVLSPSTTYVWQTLSKSGDGQWKVGAEKTFTTPAGQFFGVDTTGASGVGVESATLNGEIINLGDNDNAQVYFTYWKQGQKESTLTWYTGPVQDSAGAFSTEVGLEPGTTYEYRAFGQSNEGEWKAGPVTTFTTQTGQSYGVSTGQATNVDADSATLQGELTGLGDYDSATVYFTYWKQGQKSSTLTWWTGSSLSSPGQFDADVAGLDAETTYVFQAYAQSDTGKWTAGSEQTLTTTAGDGASAPAVTTNPATDVNDTSATLDAEVTSLGGADSIQKAHFQYWKKGQESSTKKWTPNQQLSDSGPYSADVTGLDPETTYVFEAFVQNSDGKWAAGGELEFTTTATGGTTPSIDLLSPTEGETITGDSVTVSWQTQDMGETDHVHVYLDGANRQGSQPQDGSYTYTGVEPGEHNVTVVAAMSDHTEYTNLGAIETVNFTVEAGNAAPTASDDSASVTAGQSVSVDVLANDADSDGSLDASSVQVTSGPSSGSTAVDSSTGEITYTHDGSDGTSDGFTYSVADDDGATDTATVTVTVTQPTSSLPVTSGLVTHLEADQGVATSGGTVTGWADQSSTGIDLTGAGDPTLVSDGLNGQPAISLDGDGDKLVRTSDLTGLPSGSEDRTMFVVTKYDSTDAYVGAAFGSGDGNQAFGTVVETGGDLTVQGWGNQNDIVSDTPGVGAGWLVQSAVVASDQVTHYKDGTQIDTGTQTYDTTLDGSSSKFVIGEEIDEIGYADMEIAAVVVYDRALSETERQQVEDYFQQKYFGTGGATNQAPTASDDSASVTAGQSVSVDVLANDADSDGSLDTSSVQVTSGPSTGSTSVDTSTGEITYSAPSGASGDVSFTYSVADDDGATDTATVTVSVSAANQPPTAADDSASVTAGQSTTVEVLANDQDSDGSLDASSVQVTSGPSTGTATVNGDGTITYDASTGASGDVTFTYTVADDDGATSNEATVTVSVNQPPSAAFTPPSDPVAGTQVSFDASGSSDPDGSIASYEWDFQNDGTVDATGAPGTHTFPSAGDYTVELTVTDDDGATDSTTQTVTVRAANTAPTASDDTATVDAGQSVTVDVLSNDGDSDGSLDPSSVQVTSGPSSGSTAVDPSTGEVTYTHDGSDGTSDSFTYSVADDDGATSNEATVSVTIDQPALPVTSGLVTHLEADRGVSTSGGAVTGWADQSGTGIDLTASGDPTTITAPTGETAISLDGDGDKLVRTSDLAGLPSGSGDRTMIVVTKYDSAQAYAGAAFGDGATNQAFGLVVDGGGGKLTVQGFGGSNDLVSGTQGTGEGWLVQSAVVASDQVTHYKDGSQIDSGTRTYATDLDDTNSKFVVGEEIAQGGYADMEIAAVVVYDRALSDTERQEMESYLQEKYLGTNGGTTNQAPTASDDSASVTAGQSTTIDVLANDQDSDGSLDTSSVAIVSQPTTGMATVENDGTITYSAPSGASGDVTFTYTVADDDGATSNEATVTVTVNQPTTSSLPVTSGLVTHLEADQGVTASGGQVTGWTDQSGTGIDLSSAGDPQLQSNALNGQPAISLDGDGDKLVRTGDLTGLPSGAQDRTMFVVTKYDNANDWAGTAFGNGDSNQAFGLVVKGGSGALTVQGWGNDLVSGTQGTGADWLVQSAVVASDQVTHYKNGTQIDSGSKTYDTTLDAASSKFVIGEEIAGNGYNDMHIAAVVVYDRALSETERQQVEDYLQQKYGLDS
jgi:hypothetical protein